ncbi:MAG: hypothetical protein FWD43_00920 [Coriobacteriia bacterium]|nr:hypothetical protein [Coriobacteriia bacterium]
MIYRGRYDHFHLYEVTEQDLLIPTKQDTQYHAGNVLVFPDKKTIDFGYEVAKADDFATAREYLANSELFMYERINDLRTQVEELSTRIEQRDGLLREISDDLRYEKETSKYLQEQLEDAHYQIEIEKLSRNELVSDLQQVSVDTHTVEIALEKTLTEKVKLEQELAARIVDLVDLDLQNNELKRQLGQDASKAQTNAAVRVAVDETPPKGSDPAAFAVEASILPTLDAHVLTVSSGKQVHVYHEFSAPPRRTARAASALAARAVLRFIIVVLIIAVLFVASSVIATAQLNNVSLGEALDLLIQMVKG